jgi:hypothetical protein
MVLGVGVVGDGGKAVGGFDEFEEPGQGDEPRQGDEPGCYVEGEVHEGIGSHFPALKFDPKAKAGPYRMTSKRTNNGKSTSRSLRDDKTKNRRRQS